MTGHRDDSGAGGPSTVPLDAIPDPVAGYELRGEEPIITETNDAFEASFDEASTGTTVRRWLRAESAADETAIDGVCSSLLGGDEIDTEIGGKTAGSGPSEPEPYRIRTLDGPDGADSGSAVGGRVLLTERPPTRAESVGIDSIASVISHDLRNPLDVANAHLRAARETGADEHFDQVRESHDRMERIVRDVLTLARGETALDVTEDVDLGAIATDAWATVDTGSASLSIEDDLPRADADPDRLRRLFENLFRNAVEHGSTSPDSQARRDTGRASSSEPSVANAPEDAVEHDSTSHADAGASADAVEHDPAEPGGSLEVRVGSTDEGFFVADDGTGIPVDERDRVFDPGYSAGESGSGTGLGLTIVERIADAHDWTVPVTEGAAGGARFEFRPQAGEKPHD